MSFRIVLACLFVFCASVAGANDWVQTDWSGGAAPGVTARDPENQTGWARYSSSDAVVIGPGGLTFVPGGLSQWDQTDWSGGPGQVNWSNASMFDTSSNLVCSAAGQLTLEERANWWNTSWPYRRCVTVTNASATTPLPAGYSVSATIDHASLVTAGRSLDTGADVRVLYWNGGGWLELDRVVDPSSAWNSGTTVLWFKTQAIIPTSAVDANYYIYYCNAGAGAPPANPANIFELYDDFSGGAVDGAKWNTGGIPTQVAGVLTLDSDAEYISSKATFPGEVTVRARALFDRINAGRSMFFGFMDPPYGAPRGVFSFASDDVALPVPRSTFLVETARAAETRTVTGNFSGAYRIFDVRWLTGTEMKYSINGVASSTETNNVPLAVNLPVTARRHNDTSTFDGSNRLYLDWIMVKKAINAEPTSSVGAAEGRYYFNGTLTSSSFDTGMTSPVYVQVSWNPVSAAQPPETGAGALRFQFSSSYDNVTWSSYVGPDGTGATYYGTTPAGESIWPVHFGRRYIKYRAYLQTSHGGYTPSFQDIRVTYQAAASLTSSMFNTRLPNNSMSKVQWQTALPLPAGTYIRAQIRTAPDNSGTPGAWTDWAGPGGVGTYYTDGAGGESAWALHRDRVNDQWFQYKVFICSSVPAAAPTLASITVTYPIAVAAPAPTITGSNPLDGSIDGGTIITVTGTNFQTGAYVSVGTSACTVLNVSTTTVTAVTPAGSGTGLRNVIVTNPDGRSVTLVNGFRYVNMGCLTIALGSNSPLNTNELAAATGVEVVQFRLTASATESIRITRINFTGSGTGDDLADIAAVRLIEDRNASGVYEAATDRDVASTTYDADNGAANFDLTAMPEVIPAGSSKYWLLVYDLNGLAPAGSTFTSQISTSASIESTGTWSGLSLPLQGAPVLGATITIVAPGGPGSLTIRVGPNTPSIRCYNNVQDVPIFQVSLTASSVGNITVTNTTFTAYGSGEDFWDLTGVSLYLDADGGGTLNAGDTILGAAHQQYTADDGTVTFVGVNYLIPAGATRNFLLVYDFDTRADPHQTFGARIAANGDITCVGGVAPSGAPVGSIGAVIVNYPEKGGGGGGGGGGCLVTRGPGAQATVPEGGRSRGIGFGPVDWTYFWLLPIAAFSVAAVLLIRAGKPDREAWTDQ
jgi:hypothetical protein